MALLPIIIVPDNRLRRTSSPVDGVDDRLRRLMDDLLATMHEAPGIGLSAIQVNVPKRVVVVDVARDNEAPQPVFLANPEILEASDEATAYEEGCLSLPEQYAEVLRPEQVKIGYLDYDGKSQVMEADGLLSRCLQHELDHLDGILFVDYLSTVKRSMIIRKLTKKRRQEGVI